MSTLDGQLHAVDLQTGEIKWSVETVGGSLLASSQNSNNTMVMFDKEDNDLDATIIPSLSGNLYVWTKREGGLQKFPINVRELVAQSPFYSNDGTFYMASKQTRIQIVDPFDGKILCQYATEKPTDYSIPTSCTLNRDDAVFIVRIDYAVQAIDPNGNLKWNVSYSDVQPSKVASEQEPQTLLAFSTADGLLYILERPNDAPKIFKFASQPVNIYQQFASAFYKVPLPTVMGALENSEKDVFINRKENDLYALELRNIKKRENIHKLLPSSTLPPRITVPDNRPKGGSYLPSNALIPYESPLIGFHKLRPFTGSLSDKLIYPVHSNKVDSIDDTLEEPAIDDVEQIVSIKSGNLQIITNIIITLLAIAGGVSIVMLLLQRVLSSKNVALKGPRESLIEKKEPIEDEKTPTAEVVNSPSSPVSAPEGYDRVGKFLISRTDILGHGSNGTIVYRGELDGRTVAVKRMLQEFYQIANKEISLLIQSDQHPHVVRYFAKEQNDLFVYLALEYCPYTLETFFEQHINCSLTKFHILYQLTMAIEHIHSLGIVHRDLKPAVRHSYHVS